MSRVEQFTRFSFEQYDQKKNSLQIRKPFCGFTIKQFNMYYKCCTFRFLKSRKQNFPLHIIPIQLFCVLRTTFELCL